MGFLGKDVPNVNPVNPILEVTRERAYDLIQRIATSGMNEPETTLAASIISHFIVKYLD